MNSMKNFNDIRSRGSETKMRSNLLKLNNVVERMIINYTIDLI